MGAKSLVAALLFCVVACSAATPLTYGIVKLDGEGGALVIAARPVAEDSVLHLQFPDAESKPRCCKQLSGSALRPVADGKVIASDKLTGAPAMVYAAQVDSAWTDMPFIGVVVIGDVRRTISEGEQLEATDSRGRRSKARLCTSSEGVHLTAPSSEQVRTHLYLWLGYDIESPTCR